MMLLGWLLVICTAAHGFTPVQRFDGLDYEVRGRGTLQVWVDLPPSAAGRGRVLNWEPEDTVELSGAHSYRRDLVTDTGWEDH